eukprot:CAMPEP_0116021554 /NCGR_PEP_ID=MMETSP0321-20121206/10458_1 /TAXON_ID=163516 /ORGANISM="Leptocylindrus danicus var. danicus, Strain B650" /LENGTH=111 /DNA_ID=CAMNT_0003492451 /DNA_START=476 /DNA_END=811 /DNA_ORIENTATION=+
MYSLKTNDSSSSSISIADDRSSERSTRRKISASASTARTSKLPNAELLLSVPLCTGRKGSVHTVVERLKSTSPHVFVEGSMTGDLVLRIEGTEASIRTFYNKLIPRFEDTK